MTPTPFVQRNPYKGITPRSWVRLRLVAPDGSLHERELVADTGNPFALILGQTDSALLVQSPAASRNTNFGVLIGGWLELNMPELGLTTAVLGYASDAVFQAVRSDSPDFAGLAGLPLLRMVEYGGDAVAFWVRKLPGTP
jgi:hypothetical protein